MSYRHFLDEAEKGMPAMGYILTSSDPFLHSEALSAAKELVPTDERDFNFHVFDLLAPGDTKVSFDQILDVLNTVPFFSGRKFVVVENFQKAVKSDLKKLGAYLSNPSQSSVLILFHVGPLKKDGKTELPGIRQIVLDIPERDMPAWLRMKAKSRGIMLSEDAADFLLGTVGPDLGMLSSEIDKCVLIGKEAVDRDDIIGVTEGKRRYNAFALIDAIKAKDAERIFGVYRVLKETEEPYGLLGALNWQYGKLLADRTSPKERKNLYDIFALLSEADLAIKSSGGAYPMELLLVRLLRLSRRR